MKNKFRNHPSIILEQIGAFWGAIIFFLVINFDYNEWRELSKDIKKIEDFVSVFIAFGVLFGIFLLRIVLSVIRWYKTWITVDEASITISVNTINQSVNTIGIKNISNVNIERNIFEMIIGTSKVKIDTDSYSTAESTDVSIVLKRDKAEMLKQYLIASVNEQPSEDKFSGGNGKAVDDKDAFGVSKNEVERHVNGGVEAGVGRYTNGVNKPDYDVYYNYKNVLAHCVFTAPISGIIISLSGIIIFIVFLIQQILNGGFNMHSMTALFAQVFSAGMVVVMVFLSAIYSLIKDFFKYYGFHSCRVKNRIQIEFGLFKRSSYEIPINRINAIVIQKSVISRITHRCCVDLINVGIGDENEEKSRLLLSVPDKHLREMFNRLLPEFDEYFQIAPNSEKIRQPKRVWWKHGMGVCKILLFSVIAFVAANSFHLLTGIYTAVFWCSAVVIVCLYLMGCYGGYHADKLQLHEKYLAVSDGIFAMTTTFVQYKKIQHMELTQKPMERILNLQKGVVYILASIQKSFINIPTFDKKQIEPIIELFLEDGKRS